MSHPNRIAHGFRGQRLAVLPKLVRDRVRPHPLLRGLFVTDAGIFHSAKYHYIKRNEGISTNLVIACLAGRGWIQLNGQAVEPVTPGTLAWLPANQPHAYGAAKREPWTIEWAHFEGDEVDSWRELLRIPLGGGTLTLTPESIGSLRIGTAWEHLDQGYTPLSLAAAASSLRSALASAAAQMPGSIGAQSAGERVGASIAWMKTRLSEPLKLNELASHSGLSIPHYTVLFRRQTGFSPMEWFGRLRVKWACELLDTTPLSIAEIARKTGFPDPYYFTRCFRRIMGQPPRSYRRIPKG